MKPVKNFIFAMLLVFAMAVSTTAGVQDTPGYIPPPPPQQMSTTSGDTPSTELADGITNETADYLFLETLTILLSAY